MKCPKCGAENPKGSNFCQECGSALEEMVVFDVERLEYTTYNRETFKIKLFVDMPQDECVYAYILFYHGDDPILLCEDSNVTYGSILTIRKEGNRMGTQSETFDFSQTTLKDDWGDGIIDVNMVVILSRYQDTETEYDDDVYIEYQMKVEHVAHRYRHDEWQIVNMVRL